MREETRVPASEAQYCSCVLVVLEICVMPLLIDGSSKLSIILRVAMGGELSSLFVADFAGGAFVED